MFEKEAEDRAFEKYPIPRVWNELHFASNVKYEEGFKDGAEFGYNKANEWHYVKDGDLPKGDMYLVIRLNDENTCYKCCTGFWENDEKIFHTLFCSKVDTKDIIAWKEIVLPGLKENG